MKIDFGEDAGGIKEFGDRGQLDEYLRANIIEWNTLFTQHGYENNQTFGTIVCQSWESLLVNSRAMLGQESDPKVNSMVISAVADRRLISLRSSEGQKFREILEVSGPEGCLGGWQIRTGETPGNFNAKMFQGAALYSVFTSGVSPSVLSEHKTSTKLALEQSTEGYQKLAIANQEQLNLWRIGLEARLTDFDAERQKIASTFSDFTSGAKIEVDTQRDEYQSFLEGSKAEWIALKSTFETQLSIGESVSYWLAKAETHTDSFKKLKKWPMLIGTLGIFLIGWVVFSGSIVVNYLFDFFLKIPSATLDPNGALFARIAGYKIAAMGGVSLFAFTMYVWAIRFIMRLMMTEHHLAIDASARSTMANTYLALSKSGTVSEGEKAIVLAALFKPVTDGIVRDDSMPAFSPASILANQFSKPS